MTTRAESAQGSVADGATAGGLLAYTMIVVPGGDSSPSAAVRRRSHTKDKIMDFFGQLVAAPFVCIGWLIAGAIAGSLANRIMESRQPLINDIVLGLIGSFVGNTLLGILGINRVEGGLGGFVVSIVVAVVGAVVLIALGRMIRGRR
ncbi:MAG: GlsB/YeaQ/YmgE family stress response membrane protein [bacterium]|nr:GlsB/YeaQ/YmgE family stress response membrane protein [bacterium]